LADEIIIRENESCMPARLQPPRSYPSSVAEFVLGPFLRRLGNPRPEPCGPYKKGCDYKVEGGQGLPLLVEVKRLFRSVKSQNTTREFLQKLRENPGHQGFTPPPDLGYEANRYYHHAYKAAGQIEATAEKLKLDLRAGFAAGILVFDVDENRVSLDLGGRIAAWMTRPWATSIDTVLLVEHRAEVGRWGTTASAVFFRNPRVRNILTAKIGLCTRGHFHVGNEPDGECRNPFMDAAPVT
jgi:hypothetical protein